MIRRSRAPCRRSSERDHDYTLSDYERSRSVSAFFTSSYHGFVRAHGAMLVGRPRLSACPDSPVCPWPYDTHQHPTRHSSGHAFWPLRYVTLRVKCAKRCNYPQCLIRITPTTNSYGSSPCYDAGGLGRGYPAFAYTAGPAAAAPGPRIVVTITWPLHYHREMDSDYNIYRHRSPEAKDRARIPLLRQDLIKISAARCILVLLGEAEPLAATRS